MMKLDVRLLRDAGYVLKHHADGQIVIVPEDDGHLARAIREELTEAYPGVHRDVLSSIAWHAVRRAEAMHIAHVLTVHEEDQ